MMKRRKRETYQNYWFKWRLKEEKEKQTLARSSEESAKEWVMNTELRGFGQNILNEGEKREVMLVSQK